MREINSGFTPLEIRVKDDVICRKQKFLTGFTLVEVLVSIGIMAIIFGSVLSFLNMSENSWQIGRDKLWEQQQARIAVDNIIRSLQFSNPRWQDAGGNNYTVTLANSRIDFYIPRFYPDCCPDNCANVIDCWDAQGFTREPEDIQHLVKVTYKLNPNDLTQLLRKAGYAPTEIVAQRIANLTFNCGCANCTGVDESCPFVDISVTTQDETQYQLQSTAALRNRNITLLGNIVTEEPLEEEF